MALPTSTLVPSAQTALNNAKGFNFSGISKGIAPLGVHVSSQMNSSPASGLKVSTTPPPPDYGAMVGNLLQPQSNSTFSGAASSVLSGAKTQPLVSSTIGQPPPNPNANGTLPVTPDQTFGVTDAQKAAAAQMNGTNTGGLAPQANQQSSQQTQSTDSSGTPTGAGIATNLLNSTNTNTGTYASLGQKISDITKQFADQEANLTQGYNGIGADATSARIQQLEQFKNSAIAAVEAEQGKISQFQTQAQGAANIAGGLVTNTVQAPYGTPLYQTGTGKFVNSGGSTGGGLDPQTQATQLADLVVNGQKDYSAALSEMSQYGAAAAPALRNAILAKNPNFNFNLSESSAQTQAQGQQLNTQVTTANQALDTLGTSFSALSGLQTGGIPASNSIAQWIGQELGDQALSKYKSNLADARAQLVGVLNASGGTPTGNEATAMQYLPDNMTPAMFQANVGTAQNPGIVRQLMQQKAQTFTQSGQQNQSSSGGSVSGFGWNG